MKCVDCGKDACVSAKFVHRNPDFRYENYYCKPCFEVMRDNYERQGHKKEETKKKVISVDDDTGKVDIECFAQNVDTKWKVIGEVLRLVRF